MDIPIMLFICAFIACYSILPVIRKNTIRLLCTFLEREVLKFPRISLSLPLAFTRKRALKEPY